MHVGRRHPLLAVLVASALVVGVAGPASASPTTGSAGDQKSSVPPVSPVSDAASATTEAAAQQIASRYNHAVTVDSLTTDSTLTRALPNGSRQFVSSSLPERARVDGQWHAIDLDLVRSSDDGLLAPKVSDYSVQFSAGGTGPLARIRDSSGRWVEESSPFGALPTPSIDGAVAIYREVLSGVDLRVAATATGMSEVLVVKNAIAAANPRLAAVRFAISGGEVTPDGAGNARVQPSDGGRITASAPTWWDSTNGSDASGPVGVLVPTPVNQTLDSDAVSMRVTEALTSRVVKYPAYIDPDWSGGQNAFWYVDQAYPTGSYLNGNQAGGVQRMGYCNSTCSSNADSKNHLARAFWAMNTAGIAGKQVSVAQFSVVLSGAASCSIARQADLWTTSGAPVGGTWNQTGAVYSQVVGSATPGGCGAPVGFNALIAAQQAAAAGASQTTLALRASNEGDNLGWKKWAQGATLTVTYNSIPAAPSALLFSSPSRTCSSSSTSPTAIDGSQPVTLQASVSDADTGQNLATTFAINGVAPTSYSSSLMSSRSGSGTTSVTIPANTFVSGALYKWNATTNDGNGGTSPVSGDCYFRGVTTSPAPPTVTKTSTGTAVVGQPITVQFGSSPTDGVKVFGYWWVADSGTSAPASPAASAVTPGGALPACGSQVSSVHFVCPDSGSLNATGITTAPVDTMSTLWVASYNDAGRVSVSAGNYAGSLHLSSNSDTTNVALAVGHIWDSSNLALAATAVPDSNTTAGSSGSTTRQTLGAPIQLVKDSSLFGPTSVLKYTATSALSQSERNAIDTKNSFTVSAYMNLSSTAATSVAHTALSEGTATGSAFSVGTDATDHATFCRTTQVNSSTSCVTGAKLIRGQWTFVTGIWDASNQTLRISNNDTIVPDATAPQPIPAGDTSPNGWLYAGGIYAMLSGTTTQHWEGLLYRPSVFPGVVSSQQLDNLFSVLGPNDSEPPVTTIGTPVTVGCPQLITPQQMYDYDPNYSGPVPWTPAAGSPSARALQWNGVACQWLRPVGGSTLYELDVSVANVTDRGTQADLHTAAATGTPVTGYGDAAYFRIVNGFGQLEIFKGNYWIVLTGQWVSSGHDNDPLPSDVLAALP
jgi:hypothetical protein